MKRLTIEQMHEDAKKHNGKCLSTEYVDSKTKLTWQCEQGHTFEMIPNMVRTGQWCPTCANLKNAESKRIPYEKIEALVNSKGGRIVSGDYVDGNSTLTFECKHKHQWTTKASTVWHGRWCPKCQRKVANKKTSHSIEYMQELAKSRGGECLSTEYKNNRTPLEWRCKHGHIWKGKAVLIIRGQWCPVCYRDTIDDLHAHAKKKNGKCLSSKYLTTIDKYKWECDKGHQWKATWHSVKKGSWCAVCEGKAKKTIDDVRTIAKKRGGVLISKKYVNSSSPLEWRCQNGHIFMLSYSDSKNHWCPVCRHSVGEEMVRSVFEEMFQARFPKVKPSWLRNKRLMELDGFNQELNIAFEHQGQQHYRVVKRFHPNGLADLDKQQKRDELKRALCKKHDILLIEVPEYGSMTKTVADIETLILSHVNNDKISHHYDLDSINLDSIFYRGADKLNELRKIAYSYGGKLLSDIYLHSRAKLKWRCKYGHIFYKNADDVKNAKRWCPECNKRERLIRKKEG